MTCYWYPLQNLFLQTMTFTSAWIHASHKVFHRHNASASHSHNWFHRVIFHPGPCMKSKCERKACAPHWTTMWHHYLNKTALFWNLYIKACRATSLAFDRVSELVCFCAVKSWTDWCDIRQPTFYHALDMEPTKFGCCGKLSLISLLYYQNIWNSFQECHWGFVYFEFLV